MRTYRLRPRDRLGNRLTLNGYRIHSAVGRDMLSTREDVFVSYRGPQWDARRLTIAVTETFFEEAPQEVSAESWVGLARAVAWPYLPEALAALYIEGPSWVPETTTCAADEIRPGPPLNLPYAVAMRELRDEQERRFGYFPTGRGAGKTLSQEEWRRRTRPEYLVQDEAVDYDEAKLEELLERSEIRAMRFKGLKPGEEPEVEIDVEAPMPMPTPLTLHLVRWDAVYGACGKELGDADVGTGRPDSLADWPEFRCRDCEAIAARELAPSAVAAAPGIDRSGPRVYCQSQFDPDE